jgi:flagellar biosynthetic protein FliR
MLFEALPAAVFPYLLVFVRTGAAMMVMPSIGENGLPARSRLHFAIAFTVLITPVLAARLPAAPDAPLDVGVLVGGEVLIGLFFGTATRMLMSAMHVAGMVFSFHSGLAAATMFDPNQTTQTSLFGNFLSLAALVMIFATDMHHLMLRALVNTYALFPAGEMLPIGDSADAMARMAGDAFHIGFQLAAPIVVAGFLLYLGAGLLNRLMPQMMVFFVVLPIQIAVGFFILAISLSAMMAWFLGKFGDVLYQYFLVG